MKYGGSIYVVWMTFSRFRCISTSVWSMAEVLKLWEWHLFNILAHFKFSMKYGESIKVVRIAFFKILAHLNFSMKYEASIEVASCLHHFIMNIEYGGSIKSCESYFSRSYRISSSFYKYKYEEWIISMKYDGSSTVMKKAFFEILVYCNFSMKYKVSIKVVFLHHFTMSMEYGGSMRSWEWYFSRSYRISSSFYHKYEVWGKY